MLITVQVPWSLFIQGPEQYLQNIERDSSAVDYGMELLYNYLSKVQYGRVIFSLHPGGRLEEISTQEIMLRFPHLENPGIQIEATMLNERTLCVMVNIRMKDLIDIVDNQGWQCVFDRGVAEDETVFTCLARQI